MTLHGPEARSQERFIASNAPDMMMDLCTSPTKVRHPEQKTHGPNIDVESENARLQVHFEKKMKERARGHRKVSVLLSSWEKEAAAILILLTRVRRLSAVFKDLYNSRVCPQTLNTGQGKKPEHQIHKHLADFVHDEDGKDTLMIIYYAGHGISDTTTGRLLLVQSYGTRAECLINDIDGDMLSIFDCCHAGQLAGTRTREFSHRIFEFLGATQANDTTKAPGPDSFTSALIWALKAFSNDVDGFATSQLLAKILEAPDFPLDDGQRPCLTE